MQLRAGLDIGPSGIKLVKVQPGNPVRVVSAISAPLPPNALFSEKTSDQELIVQTIKTCVKDSGGGVKEVFAALPESNIFTKVLDMPILSDEEVASALTWQAEQYIPLPLSEVTLDYAVLKRPTDPKEKMRVLVVAAPLSLVTRLTKTIQLADLLPLALETSLLAAARILTSHPKDQSTLLYIDCGSQSTDIAISGPDGVEFTHAIALGGSAITRSIAEAFSFSETQAEEYKKTYGLDSQKQDGKVRQAAMPVLDAIVAELKKALAFYQQKNQGSLSHAILFGGGALLPSLTAYFAERLGLQVTIGNPWDGFQLDPAVGGLTTQSCLFTVATGLSLRES